MKKWIYTAVLLLFAGALAGCANQQKTQEGEQRYAYPLATASPEDTVTQIYAEKFVEEVDRLSEGRIKIQVYPNSVLGGDRELLESCYDGDIPFIIQNTAPQVTFIPGILPGFRIRASWIFRPGIPGYVHQQRGNFL